MAWRADVFPGDTLEWDMTEQVEYGTTHERTSLATAVRIAENIGGLPAVPTQNWCDLAAATLLPLARSLLAVVMLGQIDDAGRVVRQEATGVAGGNTASVTTTIGRTIESSTSILLDPSEPTLAGLRASMSQAKELGWSPNVYVGAVARAGMADELGIGNWRQGPLGKRWMRAAGSTDPASLSLMLGAVLLPGQTPGRVILLEVGVRERGISHESALAVFAAVLPSLARRAFAAVGSEPSDSTHWLTTREQTILNHLLMGKSVREIATELGRSPHTVHDHVKALHRKLGANSRGELVARALGHLQHLYVAGGSEQPSAQGTTTAS